jgi:ribulose-5-phosphate 4-epimerase/fuculose-1-phosphate aldolase
MLRESEVRSDYEGTPGGSSSSDSGKSTRWTPAVLVAGHGPFTWGKRRETPWNSLVLNRRPEWPWPPGKSTRSSASSGLILRKHFQRKHGPDAYYGQKKKKE